MFKGIFYVLVACFIWGLIFVIPPYIQGFNSMEVALGRYFFFGIISLVILARAFRKGSCKYPLGIWKKALSISLFSSIAYYSCVVFSLRYSTPAICALILGLSPITITLYGNWKEKEFDFRSLMIPSLMILIGLIMINVPHMTFSSGISDYLWGLLAGMVALIIWTWFAVANAQFLKKQPQVSSSDWSTLIGVATFFWVCLFGTAFFLIADKASLLERYSTWNQELGLFLLGSMILGFVCSWIGGFCWNKASRYLPLSMAGQFMIFETLFGLLFFYLLSGKIPPLWECLGIFLLLSAIIYSVRLLSKSVSLEHS